MRPNEYDVDLKTGKITPTSPVDKRLETLALFIASVPPEVHSALLEVFQNSEDENALILANWINETPSDILQILNEVLPSDAEGRFTEPTKV